MRPFACACAQAAESLGSLSPAMVDCILLELVRALPAPSTSQAVAPMARADERATSAALADQGAVSIDGANEGAVSSSPANQKAVSTGGTCEEAASVALANQNAMTAGGSDKEATPIVSAGQGAASADVINEEAVSAAPADTTPGEGHVGDGSANKMAARWVVPPREGSSYRFADRSPRAVKLLDVREASYLHLAASRVRKLWTKADAEGWAEQVYTRVSPAGQ